MGRYYGFEKHGIDKHPIPSEEESLFVNESRNVCASVLI